MATLACLLKDHLEDPVADMLVIGMLIGLFQAC